MQKVIDVRDMHTAIHSLYIVNRKPKTTLKLFKKLDGMYDDYELEIWSNIFENVEYFGEIDFHYITGDKFWRGRDLISDNEYHCGDDHFKLIGSFDVF